MGSVAHQSYFRWRHRYSACSIFFSAHTQDDGECRLGASFLYVFSDAHNALFCSLNLSQSRRTGSSVKSRREI